MECFKKILENRHQYALEWKERTGGKVCGYYETYFPEEIVYAAGMLPVRLFAEHLPDDTSDRQIYGCCYVARDLLNQFNKGVYDYVDAIVNTEGCQWMYHSFEAVLRNRPDLNSHYFFMPDCLELDPSKDVVASELKILQKRAEEWTGNTVSVEDLDRAIEVYNKTRMLLRRLYDLRRVKCPKILGSEAMEIVLASQIMDKAEFNEMLEAALDEIEEREPGEDLIRLILIGS